MLAPAREGLSSGMHPHVVVAKSAQPRFRVRRKLRPLPCTPRALPHPLRGLGRSSSPHRAGRGGTPYRSCQKRNGPCTVQRERRRARSGAVALRAYGGRRTSACSDLALPSGTLCSSAISPTAVPWRMVRKLSGCKNAFDQLLFPRVPLRYALAGWRTAKAAELRSAAFVFVFF